MKLLIAADMEGISGVVSWDQVDPKHPEYARFRKIMTGDVNAAVDGAFRGGAEEVVVADGHSGGYNILLEDLDPRARLNAGNAAPLAMVQGASSGIAAALFVGYHGKCGWYLYGASSEQHRNLMAAYLLQWESIQWAKGQGCTEYDLYGIPDHDEEELEAQFSNRSDGLWGVYRFKRGFGGQIQRHCQAWEKVYGFIPYSIFKLIYTTPQIKNFYYWLRNIIPA